MSITALSLDQLVFPGNGMCCCRQGDVLNTLRGRINPVGKHIFDGSIGAMSAVCFIAQIPYDPRRIMDRAFAPLRADIHQIAVTGSECGRALALPAREHRHVPEAPGGIQPAVGARSPVGKNGHGASQNARAPRNRGRVDGAPFLTHHELKQSN